VTRRDDTHAELGHDEAWLLLPWYVSNALTVGEHARMERHIRGCLSCRAALKSEERIADLLEQRAARDLHVEAGFRELEARIDDAGRTGTRFFGAFHGRQRWWALAASAVATVAVVGVVASFVVERDERPFETVTDVPASAVSRIDIVFESTVPREGREALIREFGLTVVAGPSRIGRLTVEGQGETNALIQRLASDDRILFAGRSFIVVDE
jgi:anti-sigma-K factor RskA